MSQALPTAAGRRWARQLLVSALALARAALRASAAPELTVPEALVLWWLTRYPGCTAGQLSLDLGMEPSGVSVAIQGLERRGMLARVPDPRDRRRSFLRTTAPGRRAAAIALGAFEVRLEAAASEVSPGQMEAASQVLSSLLGALSPRTQGTPMRRPSAASFGLSAPGGRPRAASRSPRPAPGPSRTAPAPPPARPRTRRSR